MWLRRGEQVGKPPSPWLMLTPHPKPSVSPRCEGPVGLETEPKSQRNSKHPKSFEGNRKESDFLPAQHKEKLFQYSSSSSSSPSPSPSVASDPSMGVADLSFIFFKGNPWLGQKNLFSGFFFPKGHLFLLHEKRSREAHVTRQKRVVYCSVYQQLL